ncbi:MAG: glucokinase [Gammaproteobacteria bacterium]|nr:glucokinase [Gammaproteobacteria bacterium]MBT5407778.1 glucokinase [Gammaproteobacteria bacterium]MBT6634848.1 glucokinase [Gammaproteobacteria bacterium]
METVTINKQSYNLVGDIGATNARFALVAPGSSDIENIQSLKCEDFDNIQSAISFYISSFLELDIVSACFATAGTVHLDVFKLANNHWTINKSDVAKTLNGVTIKWINDFTAQAFATTTLTDGEVITLNKGIVKPEKLRLVIGPGTGLGVCGLIMSPSGWLPIAGEGGHSDFAPNTSIEYEILTLLAKKFGHVAVERILSGPGIMNLYEALCQINGKDRIYTTPSEITAAAVNAGADPIADETIQMFCKIFGSVAGSMALTVGALGGVYITSDLVRNFLDLFIESDFQKSFESKGRLQSVLEDIPVYLSKKKNMGLIGTVYEINNYWMQKGFKV